MCDLNCEEAYSDVSSRIWAKGCGIVLDQKDDVVALFWDLDRFWSLDLEAKS